MKSSKDSVYSNIKFFFYILRAFGLAPFTFDEKNKKLHMKLKNYLILMLSIILCISCSWASLYNFYRKSEILERIWQMTFLLQHIFANAVIVLTFLKRKNIESFWKALDNFDQTLIKLKWKYGGDKLAWSSKFVIGFVVAFFLFVIFYSISAFFFFSKEIGEIVKLTKLFIYQITSFFYLLIAIQFMLSVHCIRSRLKALKKNFE